DLRADQRSEAQRRPHARAGERPPRSRRARRVGLVAGCEPHSGARHAGAVRAEVPDLDRHRCCLPGGEVMIEIKVNGEAKRVDADPEMPLLWVLRDLLGLTGTKFGCGEALCGACTVHLDGMPVRACVTPVSRASGKMVTTIEGLSPTGDHPL